MCFGVFVRLFCVYERDFCLQSMAAVFVHLGNFCISTRCEEARESRGGGKVSPKAKDMGGYHGNWQKWL